MIRSCQSFRGICYPIFRVEECDTWKNKAIDIYREIRKGNWTVCGQYEKKALQRNSLAKKKK
jgi:putative component of membrane protein insertase Oxa1/YidC/SpoIIIJ protein YidD